MISACTSGPSPRASGNGQLPKRGVMQIKPFKPCQLLLAMM